MYKTLWFTFYTLILVVTITTSLYFFGIDLTSIGFFKMVIFGLPVILLLFHSIHILGIKRALIFIALSTFVGWLAETIGLKYGQFFGGQYVYANNSLKIGAVPVDVVLYWSVFIYTSYSMVNGMIRWKGIKLDNLRNVVLGVVADGIFLTSIDLFMDPIQIREGAWTWINGGPYFGVPIGNFIGWFVVGFVTTGIFRFYSYNTKIISKFRDNLLLIPTIGYGLLILSFSMQALEYQMYKVLYSGLIIMGSLFTIVIYSYIRRSKDIGKPSQ